MEQLNNKQFIRSKKIWRVLKARLFSIMIVPYNKKSDSKNFHVSLLTIILAFAIFISMLAWFIYTSKNYISLTYNIAKLERANETKRISIAAVEEHLKFYAVNYAPKKLHIQNHEDLLAIQSQKKPQPAKGGPILNHQWNDEELKNFYEELRIQQGNHLDSTRKLLTSLDKNNAVFTTSRKNIEKLEAEFESKEVTLSGLPSQWPLKNGMGESYKNNNQLIISSLPGSQIISTASGKVTSHTKGSDGLYSLHITHPLGFSSKYENILSPTVHAGDTVIRGQALGVTTKKKLVYSIHINNFPLNSGEFTIFKP